MTSPYLEKPKRGLDQALQDRGMSRADVGFDQPGRRRPATARSHRRRGSAVAALGGALVVGLVVLGHALLTRAPEAVPAIAEDQIDALQEIAPAAGE